MELLDQKYLKINNVLKNLVNYNNKGFLKDTIHSFIENILYYKLFIDNYSKLNNYVNKYSDFIHSVIDSNISDSEKTDILKKILQKILLKQQTGGMNLNNFKEQIFTHADQAIEKEMQHLKHIHIQSSSKKLI
jgi:predicted PolB exonuclease-like 3'-5' exonuclease